MKKIIMILVFSTNLCLAQNSNLNFEDAILGNKNFYKDNLYNIQWIKNSNEFSYVKNNILIVEDSNIQQKRITLEKINKILEADTLNSFNYIKWINSSNFIFQIDLNIYKYNFENDHILKMFSLPDNSSNIEYSHDLSKVAFTINNNLFILDSKNKLTQISFDNNENIVNGQIVHRNEFGIDKGIFWSNNDKYIAYYKKDERMVSNYPIINSNSRIASIRNIKYPMAGMSSHEVKLYVYDISKKKSTMMRTGEPNDKYLTNICWGPNNKNIFIAVLNRDQNHLKLNSFNINDGKLNFTLFEEKNKNYVQPLNPMIFINNSEFLWRSERDGFDHYYRYNTNGKIINQVTLGNFVVKDFISIVDDSLFFTGSHNNGLDTRFYKSSLFNSESEIITKIEGVHKIYPNSMGTLYIDSYSSANNPGTINLINSSGKNLKTIHQRDNPFSDIIMGNIEIDSFKLENGIVINTRIIKPYNYNDSIAYPVLLYVYNGPNVQLIENDFLASSSLWMHYLANQGYIILTIDGRGSENRGLDFEQIIFRNLGEIEMKDQIRGLQNFISKENVDKNRIAVYGWSYGGYMATNLLCTYPDFFSCGVAGGPVIDWKYYEVMYTERYMDTPEINPDGYKKSSILNKIHNLSDPLLVIHGTDDDVVVLQHSLKFSQKCIENKKEFNYFQYPGHDHHVRGKDRLHLMNKIINFILENNL